VQNRRGFFRAGDGFAGGRARACEESHADAASSNIAPWRGASWRVRAARSGAIVMLKDLRGAFTVQLSHSAAGARKDEQFIHELNWQKT
jgi:hypothetical protein